MAQSTETAYPVDQFIGGILVAFAIFREPLLDGFHSYDASLYFLLLTPRGNLVQRFSIGVWSAIHRHKVASIKKPGVKSVL